MAQQQLKHVRARLRLSQRQLAELANVAKQTMADAENGKTIRLTTAYAILDALNTLLKERNQPELELDGLDWHVEV
jgi:DNA-binding XRE family transcriptional regulator